MAADPGSRGAESSRWRRSADGGDALSDQSCGMCAGEGAPPVHRVRSGSAIDSLLRHGSVVTVLVAGVSVWDAEPSRSERRGSESRLRVRALSSRAVFALTAVAPLLPTMTTVGSGVTIGSPAISSAGGGRSGLEGPRAPCCRRVEIDMQLDGSPEKVRWFSRRDRQCGGERLDRIRAFRREQCCKRGAVRRSA